MAQVDWQTVMNPELASRKKRFQGANVKFFNAYNENREKSLKEGRPVFDEIPSISIQWPGMDETVRRIEPQDIEEYPDLYARFKSSSEPVTEGLPLSEWPPMTGSAMRELQYLGFKTVEQLANANDDVKRRLGPLSKFVKLAQDWIEAAKSDQSEIVRLRQLLEREEAQRKLLQERLELFMQRVEANEGTDLRGARRAIEADLEPLEEDVAVEQPRPRGRPRKV
jgi:hypothetical protein